MKIAVPAKWKEVTDRLEARGIEVSVIGRSGRGKQTAAAFIKKAKQPRIETPPAPPVA